MKKLKTSVTCLLVVAMALSCLSLAGCGGNNATASTISKDKSFEEEEGSAYSGIQEYAGSKIKFATWIDHTKGEGAVPMASFADKYDIEVEIVPIPQNDYVTKLSGMIGAGQSPDMIVDNREFPYIFPLAEDLSTVKSIDLNDEFWDKSVTEMGTLGGKPYFVNSKRSPWTYRFMCVYNIKLFEDNGFKSPGEYYAENNWTIDTFTECATRISRLGSDYIGASVRPEFATGIWESSSIVFNGGKFVSGLDDSKLSTAYKWMLSNKEKGIFTTVSATDAFKKNLCGLFLYGDFGLRATGGFDTMNPDIIGYVPMPKVSASDKYYPSTGTWRAYGICKGSKNAEATGYFLRYFLDYGNYDTSVMYKSDRAAKFYDELREIEDHCFMLFTASYEGGTDVAAGSSAQVDTNLKKLQNQIDARIKKDNAYLK